MEKENMPNGEKVTMEEAVKNLKNWKESIEFKRMLFPTAGVAVWILTSVSLAYNIFNLMLDRYISPVIGVSIIVAGILIIRFIFEFIMVIFSINSSLNSIRKEFEEIKEILKK